MSTGRIPPEDLVIRPMTEAEARTLVGWAHEEGWNPGNSDAALFWQTDPEGFVAAEWNGELIGGGAITAYGRAYGFMGLFIIRPAFRGQGLGRALWYARRDALRARLDPQAPIAMDGVVAMEPFYARGGFVKTHQNRCYRFVAGEGCEAAGDLVSAATVDAAELAAFDRLHFPGPRSAFLQAWIRQPGARAWVRTEANRIVGFGVRRPCGEGHKIGPLFAHDVAVAEELLEALQEDVPGETLFLDIPDANPAGAALIARHDMEEVFSCARMVLGPPPRVRDAQIFGITTFELG